MNIVILGAGSIGSYLALVLSQEGHNVIVIDRDDKALDRLCRSADVATRCGSGIDYQILKEIKEHSPDFFIAMSSSDETNLVACAIAHGLGYPKTVARVRQNFLLDHPEIDLKRLFSVDHIVGTERIVAHDVFRCLINPGNLAVENFAHGAVQMRTLVVPENFSERGKPLAQAKLWDRLLVGLISRKQKDGTSVVIFPKGSDSLQARDEVTIIGKTGEMRQLHEIFGSEPKAVRSAVIAGGSGIATYLVQLLLEQKIRVKIIEHDEQKCALLARQFPSAVILNHDVTDLHFLEEEEVATADVFIACTQSQETNVLAAILARQAGCQESIALVADEVMAPLLHTFQISYAPSERLSIARRIKVIISDDTLVALASLYEGHANILEVKVSEESRLIHRPIAELGSLLPKNFLIAMIKSRQGIAIAKGSSVLSPGDTAIVICDSEGAKSIQKLF